MRSGTLRHRLPGRFDPATVYSRLLRDSVDSFWLDSSDGSGRSWMGTGIPLRPAESGGAALVDAARAALAARSGVSGAGAPIGLIGWFEYELGAWTTPSPHGLPVTEGPHGALLDVDRLIQIDETGAAELVALGAAWDGELACWRAGIEDALRTSAGASAPLPRFPEASSPGRSSPGASSRAASSGQSSGAVWRDSDEEYLAKVAACKAAIARGDAYQLCLTTSAQTVAAAHPLDVYLRLRAISPTHHGGLLRIGGAALLSASPEQFLAVDEHGVVSTSPIKGTRPRGTTPQQDERLRTELAGSDKEQAENLMIVDLMRNDLARVCDVGSVEVSRLLAVESYPQVHQLVSTVRGRLAPGRTALDAVAACFPAGSMTGAPKRSAMSILAGLEAAPRGVYSGVFGYLGADGTADLAMVIRSIVIADGTATVGAGGGITALSVPEEELAEVKLKAAALLRVLGTS